MPCPKKHHSPEDKRNANRQKSKHSYDSRLKDNINSRRQEKYQKKRDKELKLAATAEHRALAGFRANSINSTPTMTPSSAKVAHARGIARRLDQRLMSLTQQSPKTFLERVCCNFHLNRLENLAAAKDIINAHVVTFGKLQKEVVEQQDQILQIVGVGEAWQELESILQKFRKVVAWLEDVLCVAMVDPELLLTEFNDHRLLFQLE